MGGQEGGRSAGAKGLKADPVAGQTQAAGQMQARVQQAGGGRADTGSRADAGTSAAGPQLPQVHSTGEDK
jgi:hypothetical protein